MRPGGGRRVVVPALGAVCVLLLSARAPADDAPGTAPHIHDYSAYTDPFAPGMPGEDPDTQRIRELESRLEAEPASATVAAELARAYLERFRFRGDPELVALAADALSAWQDEPRPPVPVALERAVLWQTEHRFAAAFGELERVVAQEPRHARAWLTLASVAKEIGRYPAAVRACGQLLWLADPVLGGACLASVWADTGRAEHAYPALERLLQNRDRGHGIDVTVWIHSLSAEAANSMGRADLAEAHFIRALDAVREAGRPPELYLLVEYADFLVGEERPEDVVALLSRAPRSPSIALRLADARRTVSF